MKKGLVLFVIWLFSLIINVQAQGIIRILSDDFFRSSRELSSDRVPFSRVVLDASEIPEEFQVDSLVILGSFRVYDKDLGWTSNRSWFLTNKQERELERKLEQFDIQYGRENLVIFSIGLVDKHKYLTGEPPDGARGHALGFRRGHDGVHNIKRLWGDHFPVFYAGYKFGQPQRGVEYVVCRRQRRISGIQAPPPPETVDEVEVEDNDISPVYFFVEWDYNEYYLSSTLPINSQRLGFGYRSNFSEWFIADAKFSPLNYQRISGYFSSDDVRQYSSASLQLSGEVVFPWVKLKGSDYFVYDYESGTWDENSLKGEFWLTPWKFRLGLLGQTSFLNFLPELRPSEARFNLMRVRAGIEHQSGNQFLEIGYQATVGTKYHDEFYERTTSFKYGGIYLNYFYDSFFWLKMSWEVVNVGTFDKIENMFVDPPEHRFEVLVGLSIPLIDFSN